MAIDRETEAKAIQMIGRYLIDHADEFIPIEWSDMESDDIQIHLKRREVANERIYKNRNTIQPRHGWNEEAGRR